MTVVIGYANKDCAIMLADRMVTCVEDLDSYEEKKLISIPECGWVSGAGHGDLLNDFKRIISEQNSLSTIEQMVHLFGFLGEKYKAESEESKALVCKTSGMLALTTSFEDTKVIGRIAMISYFDSIPHHWFVEHNRIQIIYPSDLLNNELFIKSLEAKYPIDSVEGNIEEIISLMLAVAKEIVKSSKYVSTICDIGLIVRESDGWRYWESPFNLKDIPDIF